MQLPTGGTHLARAAHPNIQTPPGSIVILNAPRQRHFSAPAFSPRSTLECPASQASGLPGLRQDHPVSFFWRLIAGAARIKASSMSRSSGLWSLPLKFQSFRNASSSGHVVRRGMGCPGDLAPRVWPRESGRNRGTCPRRDSLFFELSPMMRRRTGRTPVRCANSSIKERSHVGSDRELPP